MLARFEREVSGVVLAELERLDLDLHAWVTLASMVQAEAGDDGEMGIIAGVFLNRLDLGMPLQSDPTVAYGLGKDLPELDRPAGDFEADHPWNTYTRAGPPDGADRQPRRGRPRRRPDADAHRRGRPLVALLPPRLRRRRPRVPPNLGFDDHLRDVAPLPEPVAAGDLRRA